jgi:hypothetical protein
MTKILTRQELYDLVWSTPLKTLAPQFGVSDVGLKKACLRGNIPVPERGYWAKVQANKKVGKVQLPTRSPGMDDEIHISGSSGYRYRQYTDEELLGPLPPEPVFCDPIEALRAEIYDKIGKVTTPKDLSMPHRAVAELLKKDDQRRAKHLEAPYLASWDPLLFDSTKEKRRLRIASAILTALSKLGYRATNEKEGQTFHVAVGSQTVSLMLSYAKSRGGASNTKKDDAFENSKLLVSVGQEAGQWHDSNDDRIESHLRNIATEVVVAGELQYRSSRLSAYNWRKERKAALEEQRHKEAEEARRRERERQEKLERARIERLLSQAAALRQATEIRTYVQSISNTNSTAAAPVAQEEFISWQQWALTQADRIDPTLNGTWRDDCI